MPHPYSSATKTRLFSTHLYRPPTYDGDRYVAKYNSALPLKIALYDCKATADNSVPNPLQALLFCTGSRRGSTSLINQSYQCSRFSAPDPGTLSTLFKGLEPNIKSWGHSY